MFFKKFTKTLGEGQKQKAGDIPLRVICLGARFNGSQTRIGRKSKSDYIRQQAAANVEENQEKHNCNHTQEQICFLLQK